MKLKFNTRCFQNINTYTLGTQQFFDSARTVTIVCCKNDSKIDVEKSLNVANMHFKNLKLVNLTNITNLKQDQIIEILKNWSINHISFIGTISDTEVDSDIESDSENEGDYEYWVTSETGCLVLYDCKYAHHIKFNNIKLYSHSSRCQTQGEYVVFDYDMVKVELRVEGFAENFKEYKSLDL